MDETRGITGESYVFRHPEGDAPGDGQVWIVWLAPDNDGAFVEVPVKREIVDVVDWDGTSRRVKATAGWVRVGLEGDPKMPPPRFVVDRAP